MTALPEVSVIATRYVVSALPEGHEDRWTFSVQVEYRGRGLYAVRLRLRFVDAEGVWDYEPDSDSDGYDDWLKRHTFSLGAALAHARRLAPGLTYRGRSAADALAEVQR
jgi:hypothetical protein